MTFEVEEDKGRAQRVEDKKLMKEDKKSLGAKKAVVNLG